MIVLELPYPVSANRYWRSFVPKGHRRAIVTLSEDAIEYKRAVRDIARRAGVIAQITGRVQVDIALYPQRPLDWKRRVKLDPLTWDDTVQSIDLDNCCKVLLDALKGVVFEDDRWVRRILVERKEPDGSGRVVVTVAKVEIESPQMGLAAAA